ncbi:hypothetical protein Patl1_23761 [Pistacia atlantica]|uniref:Uncharacterized protein n=1 Tax=Pistacia atlantica TaxID=434234 RepID=A0ACC0ZXB3_9ROSI|nr:hypothetical protein Patl1_23761 [Pistacia atlantica]
MKIADVEFLSCESWCCRENLAVQIKSVKLYEKCCCEAEVDVKVEQILNCIKMKIAAYPRAVNGEDKSPLELAVESNFNNSDVLAILSDWNG